MCFWQWKQLGSCQINIQYCEGLLHKHCHVETCSNLCYSHDSGADCLAWLCLSPLQLRESLLNLHKSISHREESPDSEDKQNQ